MEPTAKRTLRQVEMITIITAAAERHNVPPAVALAFAWLESHFVPETEGDKGWHLRKGGELYQKHVLGSERFNLNPARLDAPQWHSYGLFQLLACYHCLPQEHPRELLDPRLNAERGVAEIARLLARTNGDARAARLAYVGCGTDGHKCAESVVADVVTKLHAAITRFEEPTYG
jgi:hypothetical protein